MKKKIYSQFHWKKFDIFSENSKKKICHKQKGGHGGGNPNNFSKKIRHDLSLDFDVFFPWMYIFFFLHILYFFQLCGSLLTSIVSAVCTILTKLTIDIAYKLYYDGETLNVLYTTSIVLWGCSLVCQIYSTQYMFSYLDTVTI